MRAVAIALLLSGCAADGLICGEALPSWVDAKERQCAREKARRIENGPACAAYQRVINGLDAKCSDRPARSFDETQKPPLRLGDEK